MTGSDTEDGTIRARLVANTEACEGESRQSYRIDPDKFLTRAIRVVDNDSSVSFDVWAPTDLDQSSCTETNCIPEEGLREGRTATYRVAAAQQLLGQAPAGDHRVANHHQSLPHEREPGADLRQQHTAGGTGEDPGRRERQHHRDNQRVGEEPGLSERWWSATACHREPDIGRNTDPTGALDRCPGVDNDRGASGTIQDQSHWHDCDTAASDGCGSMPATRTC